ncbi:MAG: adenylate/guanylate cyclase domain-containing protein, partial [bacterium]|nr:adenylate/guanylate cyclase domain-containing protein [bacterium]
MTSDNIIKRLVVGIVLGLSSALFVIFITEILFPTVFNRFENQTLDLRFTRKIQQLESLRDGSKIEDIIIIDIDNRSLNKLGRFQQWRRDYYTEVIRFVSESGALIIGFDILFMERDLDHANDSLLVSATTQAQNVVHALSFSKAEPDAFLYKMTAPPPGLNAHNYSFAFPADIQDQLPAADRFDGKLIELYNAAAKLGFVNYQPDNDSVIRKMPLFMNFAGRLYPSLAMAMVLYLFDLDQDQVEIVPGKRITLSVPVKNGLQRWEIPVDQQGQMLINYQGSFQTFRYVSFYDVYAQRLPPEFFQGKIVIIGASAPGLDDIRPVPFQEAFPGVEIHANVLHNILNHEFIHQKSKLSSHTILFLLCLIVAIVSSYFSMRLNIPFLFLIGAGFIFSVFHTFMQNNLWIENVRPLIGVITAQVAVLGFKYFSEIKDKKRIKAIFQNYLSTSVVNELLINPEMLKLGGERKIATAFFSDIKNFTTHSENLEPEQLVTYLNEYLSETSEIILQYDGYLDKYEGDAIVAVFGIPMEQPDHGLRACFAALDIQNRLKKLRVRWQKQGKPLFETRIGINSGPMIAGNIGGAKRFDYTVIGDSVNLASR